MYFDHYDPAARPRRFHGPKAAHPRSGGCGHRGDEGDAPFGRERRASPRGEGHGMRFAGRHGGGRGGRGDGPGGRGGRVFGQGDLRLIVLTLIAQTPRHGYELIKAIADGFGGQYAPSPGAIYPTLSLLEEQDLIEPVNDSADGKKRYRITAAGKAWLDANREAVEGVTARMKMAARALAGEAVPERIVQAIRTLRHALALRRGPWPETEVERVAALIQSAADSILGDEAESGDRA